VTEEELDPLVACPRPFGLSTHSRIVRLLAGSAVAGVTLSTVVVGLSASPASADSIQTQIAAAQKQLDALDAEAEAATERYNAARIKLAAAQQTATTAQHRLASAQAKLATLRRAISAFAIAAYTGDPLDSTMSISTSDPQEFLDKLATLQAVTNSQQQALAAVATAQHDEAAAQSQASAALSAQQASTKSMQDDRDQVVQAAAKEQQILQNLQAKEAELIRAAKARAARIAAQQAAAALAARQAAARAALSQLYSQGSSSPVVSGSGGARTAVQWAYRELGKPYVWGAAGPNSFDCSGLTQYVWAKAGVYLDHYTGSQWNEGRHVSQSQLQPGDLVFFGSDLHHVGIYIGNGNMIEAPHSGANVRIAPYNRSDYAGAVRPGG
jgi:cell wall-associated NlpC family hydrolase